MHLPDVAQSSTAALAAQPAFVEFSHVSKSFGLGSNAVEAVRDISLNIREGELITLVGPSGCGKSTLLSMLAGIYSPSAGQIMRDGRPIEPFSGQVGYMTQNDHLLPWRTVAQNIAVPLEIRKFHDRDASARVADLMRFVGLTDFAKHYPSQLSGGMRKRTVLARLLAQDADTLLLDEPFAALDAQLRLRLQIELRRIARELRKTTLFVTHDLEEAIALGDRCVVFSPRPGTIKRIIDIGLPKDRDLLRLRHDPDYIALTTELWDEMAPLIESEGDR